MNRHFMRLSLKILNWRNPSDFSRTLGVDFINVLRTTFTPVAPQSLRFQSSCQYLFTLLGSTGAKAARRTLMKLTAGVELWWLEHDLYHRSRRFASRHRLRLLLGLDRWKIISLCRRCIAKPKSGKTRKLAIYNKEGK